MELQHAPDNLPPTGNETEEETVINSYVVIDGTEILVMSGEDIIDGRFVDIDTDGRVYIILEVDK